MSLEEDYRGVLRRNEGNPYKLSSAYGVSEDCGLSFGAKQIDLNRYVPRKGPLYKTASDILVAVLDVAKAKGCAISNADRQAIKNGDLSGTAAASLRDHPDLVLRTNNVLGTLEGRIALDEVERPIIAGDIAVLAERQSGNGPVQDFLKKSRAGQLIYLDYINFFGTGKDKFDPFLAGQSVEIHAGGLTKLDLDALFSEIVRFVFSTRQGVLTDARHRPDLLRRVNNALEVAAGNPQPTTHAGYLQVFSLTTKDETWFREPFRYLFYTDAMKTAAIQANGNQALSALEALIH